MAGCAFLVWLFLPCGRACAEAAPCVVALISQAGATPLSTALANRQAPCAALLLSFGAKPPPGPAGYSALPPPLLGNALALAEARLAALQPAALAEAQRRVQAALRAAVGGCSSASSAAEGDDDGGDGSGGGGGCNPHARLRALSDLERVRAILAAASDAPGSGGGATLAPAEEGAVAEEGPPVGAAAAQPQQQPEPLVGHTGGCPLPAARLAVASALRRAAEEAEAHAAQRAVPLVRASARHLLRVSSAGALVAAGARGSEAGSYSRGSFCVGGAAAGADEQGLWAAPSRSSPSGSPGEGPPPQPRIGSPLCRESAARRAAAAAAAAALLAAAAEQQQGDHRSAIAASFDGAAAAASEDEKAAFAAVICVGRWGAIAEAAAGARRAEEEAARGVARAREAAGAAAATLRAALRFAAGGTALGDERPDHSAAQQQHG